MTTFHVNQLTDSELDAVLDQAPWMIASDQPKERRLSANDRRALIRWAEQDRRH